jgi:hypothetical protein
LYLSETGEHRYVEKRFHEKGRILVQDDNPAENRQTAGHALISAVAATFGGGSALTLIRGAITGKSLALPHVIVLSLTTLGSALLLSVIWAGRPGRKWSLNRHILWVSVMAVAMTIFASGPWPLYWHWIFPAG